MGLAMILAFTRESSDAMARSARDFTIRNALLRSGNAIPALTRNQAVLSGNQHGDKMRYKPVSWPLQQAYRLVYGQAVETAVVPEIQAEHAARQFAVRNVT
jgi:hypothetical protein